MPRGLIFDFDGLMVETESIEFTVWSQVLAEQGVQVTEADFLPLIGTHQPGRWYGMLAGWLGEPLDLPALERRASELRRPLALAAPLLDGVAELLDAARQEGWRVGLGSSSPRRWIDLHLEHRALAQHFDAIVTRDDVTSAKPAPDIFLEVARRMGVPPSRCVVLEDSGPGCEAAHAAGMACLVVPSQLTGTSDFVRARRVARSLAEVTLRDLAALLA